MNAIEIVPERLLVLLVLVCNKNRDNSNEVLIIPPLFEAYVFETFSFCKQRAPLRIT